MVGRQYWVHGGAIAYLKKVRAACPMCRLLAKQEIKAYMGPISDLQVWQADDHSIFRSQMIDIAGPVILWPSRKQARTTRLNKGLKYWILISTCLRSKMVAATMLESYSSDSVMMGWVRLMSHHGRPQDLSWDCAANLSSAAHALLQTDDERAQEPAPDEQERHQAINTITQAFVAQGICVHKSVPYSPWRQGAVESCVKMLKQGLRLALFKNRHHKLSLLEFDTLLQLSVSHVNDRPLVLYGT